MPFSISVNIQVTKRGSHVDTIPDRCHNSTVEGRPPRTKHTKCCPVQDGKANMVDSDIDTVRISIDISKGRYLPFRDTSCTYAPGRPLMTKTVAIRIQPAIWQPITSHKLRPAACAALPPYQVATDQGRSAIIWYNAQGLALSPVATAENQKIKYVVCDHVRSFKANGRMSSLSNHASLAPTPSAPFTMKRRLSPEARPMTSGPARCTLL